MHSSAIDPVQRKHICTVSQAFNGFSSPRVWELGFEVGNKQTFFFFGGGEALFKSPAMYKYILSLLALKVKNDHRS